MKKWSVLIAVGLIAGSASAQLWSETFSTNAPPVLTQDGGAQIPLEHAVGTWVYANSASINTNGQLDIQVNQWASDGHAGKTWAAGVALAPETVSGAGTYELSVEIAAIQGDGFLGVRIWNADYDDAVSNSYYQINSSTGLFEPVNVALGTNATATLLADEVFSAAHSGLRKLEFTHDGTSDIVLQFAAMSQTKSASRWVRIDAVSIDNVVANPDVPSFTSATNTLPAASENVAYSNATAVASVTANPGAEPITYSARTTGASGLSVSSDGIISGTPDKGGTNTLYISVADAAGAYDEAVFYLFVTNVNDAPVFSSRNIDHVSGIPFSQDLSSSASDEDGDTFTYTSIGPAWLSVVSSNGLASGTPTDSEYGPNVWDIIVDDGTASSTGTLTITVQKMAIAMADDFSGGMIATGGDVSTLVSSNVTTTVSNGKWFGNMSVDANSIFRISGGKGILKGGSIALDKSLFSAGAGTYTFSFDFNKRWASSQTWVEIYGADFGAGSITVTNKVSVEPPAPISVAGGASATLYTNVHYTGTGNKELSFEYDGSDSVLLRVSAGNIGADGWKSVFLDDFMILGPSRETVYDLWSSGYGLYQADAVATNDSDGDGWNNLYEYGLGLDPTSNAVAGGALPIFQNTASGLMYVHPKHATDTSLVYTLEMDDDLVYAPGWTYMGGYTVDGTGTPGGDYNYVTNLIETTVDQRYIRLKIEQP